MVFAQVLLLLIGLLSSSAALWFFLGPKKKPAMPKIEYKQSGDVYTAEGAELLKRYVMIAALLALAVFGVMYLPLPVSPKFANWFMMILAFPVQFWIGKRYYDSTWKGLKKRSASMDTLIVFGTSAAYVFSALVTIAPALFPTGSTGVYFNTSATIITLILFAKYFQQRATAKVSEATTKLLSLSAKTAHKLVGGNEEEVALNALVVGDILRVKPGEKIPADGLIITGTAIIDASLVTGQSLPVEKRAGDSVIGATINKGSSFTMRTTKVGNNALLAQIVIAVGKAQASKAPIQRLADTISNYFAPTVIAIAIMTFVIWLAFGPQPALGHALSNSVAVLIIACPCAFGLATPIAVIATTGRAAGKGIIVREAQSLEQANKITTIVFDKTGTLTQGKLSVTNIGIIDAATSPQAIIRLSAALQQYSGHPLAKAILAKAKSDAITFPQAKQFKSYPGLGISGFVDGKAVFIGNKAFLQQQSIEVGEAGLRMAEKLAGEGKTPLFVAVDKVLVALIACADTARPEAKEVIQILKTTGIDVWMITGDHEQAAQAVGKYLGIEKIMAGVIPQDKARKMQELKEPGKVIAMVGDGVNDARALASTDIGIALGSGSDIALEATAVSLIAQDLRSIITLLDLSHKTMTNIRQNLFFAFVYNGALVLVAAGVLYPVNGLLVNPILAGGAMVASLLFVVLHASRLQKVKLA